MASSRKAREVDIGAPRTAVMLPVPQIKESHALRLDPETVGMAATVTVPPYQAMREKDRVTLTFAPVSGSQPWSQMKTLTRGDIGLPLTWSLPRRELFMIEGEAAMISYKIQYVGGGESGSATQTLEILPPETAHLPAARVRDHPGGPLDPGSFPDGVTVELDPYQGMALDDRLVVYWKASEAAKSTIEWLAVDPSVIDSGVLEFLIGPKWLQANLGGQITVTWQYARSGAAESSEPLALSVRMPLILGRPVVEKANADGVLLALNARPGVYVKAPEAVTIGDGDRIEMHWNGHPAGGRHVATAPASAEDPRRFFIPPTVIAANMGGEDKRFPVFYRLTPAGETAQDSDPFDLLVEPLEPARYPVVQCRQAEGKPGLSLADVPEEGAEIYVIPWPFISDGQPLTIRATGTTTAGGATERTVREALPVTQAEIDDNTIGGRLPREFLQTLKVGSTATLWAEVSFDGGETNTDFQRGTVLWLG